MKRYEKVIIAILSVIICGALFGLGLSIGLKHKTIVLHGSFEDLTLTYPDKKARYYFMPKEMSDYICALCDELNMDSDLVVAILMKEDPLFDPQVEHRNENGTIDLGLGQLNSAYFWSVFKKRYWPFEFDPNPFNWKHNLYITIRHIHYLLEKFKIVDEVIMAYNCGEYAVMNNAIPEVTSKYYLAAVKNNLALLKGEEEKKEND